MGGKGIGSAAQQCFVHRLAIHTDAGSKGLAPGMVDTSTDPLCLQDGRQQTRHPVSYTHLDVYKRQS